MKQLPQNQFYCQGEIACRLLRPPSKDEKLIMTIPGGPCLSGEYLDPFLSELAKHMGMNVGILDLPNHGQSILTPSKLPLSYKSCLDLIKQMLNELDKQTDGLILFGQSFGARLAFDLLAYSDVKVIGAFLTGFPYKFEMSKNMLNKIASLESSSETFEDNWKIILPLYTFSPLSKEMFSALASNTKTNGNEFILDNVPSLKSSIEILLHKPELPRIGIAQGDSDGVVPDDNINKLKSLLPHAQFFEIEKCGHFSMIENPKETLRAFSEFFLSIPGNSK